MRNWPPPSSRPYVRREVTWIVEQHGLFQSYYYAHHLGGNRDGRDKFREHPWYGACEAFCANWDQCSFDPQFPSLGPSMPSSRCCAGSSPASLTIRAT